MLISSVMEPTPVVPAMENMANRLADRVRNIWQKHESQERTNWEENFGEDPAGVEFLREESFPYLQGIDYIFKWWGHAENDGLAGVLEVLWKVRKDGTMRIYKTTIRLAIQDFRLGAAVNEEKKREDWRKEFRMAFATWHKLYLEQVCGAD